MTSTRRRTRSGAEGLAAWMRRSSKIYRHMLARMDLDDDRVVLLIDADHVTPRHQLFEAKHTVRVVQV